MADDRPVFFGWFRQLYLLVKTIGIYAGTLCICYYWPLFIQSLIDPPASEATYFVATVMLAPLGFLALGLNHGLRSLVLHVLILLAGIGVAWLLFPKAAAVPAAGALVHAWTPVLLGVYVVGIGMGFKQQLQRFHSETGN